MSNLDQVKEKVWEKVYTHIKSEERKQAFSPRFGADWTFAPLALSLVLVVLGGALVNGATNSVPGDKLYALKLKVEDVQIKLAPDPAAKQQLYIALLERRAEEITRLESEAVAQANNPIIRAEIEEKIQQAQTDAGKKALALARSPETKEVEQKIAADEQVNEILGLVKASSTQEVGKVVTSFLKNSTLSDKEKADKVKEIIKQVKEQGEEIKEGIVEGESTPSEQKENQAATTTPENSSEGSLIDIQDYKTPTSTDKAASSTAETTE